jgi:hypothetical protein
MTIRMEVMVFIVYLRGLPTSSLNPYHCASSRPSGLALKDGKA